MPRVRGSEQLLLSHRQIIGADAYKSLGIRKEDVVETIIAAFCGGGVTLVVCIINNIFQYRSTRNLIEYKLEELTKRVDKHNNVIERTYQLEKLTDLQEEKIKAADRRMDNLERQQVNEKSG